MPIIEYRGKKPKIDAGIFEQSIRVEGHSIIGYGAKVHGGEIKKGVFIGANSVILPGVKIGEYSLIPAGSMLTANRKSRQGHW